MVSNFSELPSPTTVLNETAHSMLFITATTLTWKRMLTILMGVCDDIDDVDSAIVKDAIERIIPDLTGEDE